METFFPGLSLMCARYLTNTLDLFPEAPTLTEGKDFSKSFDELDIARDIGSQSDSLQLG